MDQSSIASSRDQRTTASAWSKTPVASPFPTTLSNHKANNSIVIIISTNAETDDDHHSDTDNTPSNEASHHTRGQRLNGPNRGVVIEGGRKREGAVPVDLVVLQNERLQ